MVNLEVLGIFTGKPGGLCLSVCMTFYILVAKLSPEI